VLRIIWLEDRDLQSSVLLALLAMHSLLLSVEALEFSSLLE
jgi:hypothetical protein